MSRGPVLIDLDADEAAAPDRAPPVPETDAPGAGDGRAMRLAMAGLARRPSWLARAFWGLVLTLLGVALSVVAWDFATGLMMRAPLLGSVVAGLCGLLLVVGVLIALREAAGYARLGRLDALRSAADAARTEADLDAARAVLSRLRQLYAKRPEAVWGLARLDERAADQFDAEGVLSLAEAELLAPLDAAALREVEMAARQVATVTALVPLALADVVAALVSNLRMLRAVATIYGGRTGTLGSWRLARSVIAHLAATGAVAVGDDLISSVAGGGVLSKVSRRFGEGVVNGALTARVGLVAMDLCRPLPRIGVARPSVGGVVRRALSGLFACADRAEGADG